jgi:hypothetical protein
MTTFDSILLKLLPVQRLNNLRLSKASKENLKAEFTDELGRWWYTFQDEQDLPLIRLALTANLSAIHGGRVDG